MAVDPRAYWTPERAREEAERLWPRAWLLAAHESQLARTGDWVSLTVARDPVVIVRDGDRIRAYHDVCRHRGARITRGASGRCARLRCGYHGWEYTLGGALHAAPGATAAQVSDGPGLREVRAEVRSGFVWIAIGDAIGDEVEVELDEWLGPAAPLLATSPSSGATLTHGLRVEVPCNWKLSSDVHNEGYHLATLHPELAGVVRAHDVEVEVLERHTHFRIPLELGGRTLVKHQIYFFPNAQVNWTAGEPGVEIYRHWPHPTDAERSFFEELRLGPRGDAGESARAIELVTYGQRSFGAITDADLAMLPVLQEGMRSRAAAPFRAHPLELPITHMHAQIDAMLERA